MFDIFAELLNRTFLGLLSTGNWYIWLMKSCGGLSR